MRGSIRQRGKDPKAWSLILDAVPASDGRRKQSWITFHGTKREAENELARLITEQNSGTSVEPNKITVGEFWRGGSGTTRRPPWRRKPTSGIGSSCRSTSFPPSGATS